MVIEVFEVLEVTPNSERAHSGWNSHEMARLSMASQKGCNKVLFESFVEFAIQVIELFEVTDVIEVSDNMLLIGVARGSCNGQMSEMLVAVRRSTHAPAGQPPNCIE